MSAMSLRSSVNLKSQVAGWPLPWKSEKCQGKSKHHQGKDREFEEKRAKSGNFDQLFLT